MLDPLMPQENILSVSALTAQVKSLLEGEIGACWLQGEVSNLRRQSSGHCYFSLKDEGSQISAVLFRGAAQSNTTELRDGMEVIVYGELSVYAPRGNYQLIVRSFMEAGVGVLQARLERLKTRLAGEGLFLPEHKKAIPALPLRIGVVTSPTGAALQDFLEILRRRGWRGQISIFPCRVQGVEAAGEIAAQLDLANRYGQCDVLVLTRGGGSLEDLWPFNEEEVARAVFDSKIPVISAVGHEIDTVLSDWVADFRAETPSGAAEYLSSLYLAQVQQIEDLRERLQELVSEGVQEQQFLLKGLASLLQRLSPHKQIEFKMQQLDDLQQRLGRALQWQLQEKKQASRALLERYTRLRPDLLLEGQRRGLQRWQELLRLQVARSLESQRRDLIFLGKRLEQCDVKQTLRKGFSIVRDGGGQVVIHSGDVRDGEVYQVEWWDGHVSMRPENE